MNQHSGSATLPRGFRVAIPKTPEPAREDDEARVPSPPRPRLKLKRRNVSHQLFASTQQFLASVAAADVPIPSIEEPEPDAEDHNMAGTEPFPSIIPGDFQDVRLLRPRGKTFSPPKTPLPGFVPALTPSRYPDWTIDSAISSSVESTPDRDYESSRPSTSRSTQTSASLFSRCSQSWDDDEPFGKEKLGKDDLPMIEGSIAKGKARKAPWTKAMSDHVWAIYKLYLQDPRVTPFRMGNGAVPPHGVLLRVAREAKRSWKGAKALTKAAQPANGPEGNKSGSSTPTAEGSSTFVQWPHSCAATRAHLRDLCRINAAKGAVGRSILSQSPTPFSHGAARRWNRRSTPARSPNVFTQDMAMSLAISTAESMQPLGPLAQLTSSKIEPPRTPDQPTSNLPERMQSPFEGQPSFAERSRLSSPISPKSYGPSSSTSLAAALGLGAPMPRRQTVTSGPRRALMSPVRLSRSATVTQKRRNTQSSEPRKRPSIVADTWLDPSIVGGPSVEVTPATEFSSAQVTNRDELFIPRVNADPVLSTSTSMPNVGSSQLAPPAEPIARLGSPFTGSNVSRSFPNRWRRPQPGSVDLGMLGRPFATIQQITDSTAALRNTNLEGRLAYIDQRLKELRERERPQRRSDSPL